MISEGGQGAMKRRARPGEWQSLPRQRWESVQVKKSAEVDPLGFDKNSRILFRRSDGRHAPFFVTSGTLQQR